MKIKIKTKKIKNILQKLVEHSFLTLILICFFSLLISSSLFLIFKAKIEKEEMMNENKIIGNVLRFNIDLYGEVLKKYKIKQEEFENTDFIIYSTPF